MAPRKPALAVLMFIFMNVLVLCSCTFRLPGMPTNPLQGEFNLTKGTRWVYLYSEYEPAPSDPTQIVTAQYQFTQTVTGISRANGLTIARVQSEQKPIQVPADLPAGYMPLPPTGDFWYIIKGQQVFQSGDPANVTVTDTDTLPLAFDFPLSVNKSWCPVRIDLKDPSHKTVSNCDYAGKLTVLQESAYKVPAGRFEDCFQIEEASNGGGTFQWFCQDIGVVEIKFDHAGTRFGFEQVLTSYTKGSQ